MATPNLRPPVDLIDQSQYEAAGPPHATFAQLRRECPVYWNEMPGDVGFWSLLKYKDIFDVSLDQKTFSSAKRGVILRPFKEDEYEVQKGLLVNMDPPRHTKHRRLVSLGFSGKVIRNLEYHVREITNDIIDQVAPLGECDFVDRISAELPLQVIVEMVGVPKEDRRKVLEWSNKMIGFDDPEYGLDPTVGAMAAAELFMYANELAEDRLANPKDDLVSTLMHAEVDGERLDRADFSSFFMLLLVAGNETTRNLVSGGMLALIEHPEQRARLMADRSLLPTAVEEMLRWVSPVNVFRRTALRDTEVHGQKVREGEQVVLFYASANRDEDAFPHAETFDIGRTPNDHLAFGIGPHFCLGANLARLEIRVMFEELLRRLPDIELAGPAERLRSYFINGIKRMPVRFTPSRAGA
ncbi:MAG TPA: cytochrome P450 [Candidatus Eisenbacteria bacterium]|nr:cytochrome P450 [Candidatus Eisenbacteria bacterium]